ncbi:MAG TPA: DUF6234 family protein [Nocardioides sp.]|nr:DUF6234 family protein [Nocardioides sp.]
MVSNSRRQAYAAVETIASLIALGAMGAVFLNYMGAHLTFFGDPVVIDDEEVRNYWIGVSVLGVSLLAALVAGSLRGARRSFLWHVPVALVAVAVALLFSVTQAGPVGRGQPVQPEPTNPPAGRACHSGGDSHECPGG